MRSKVSYLAVCLLLVAGVFWGCSQDNAVTPTERTAAAGTSPDPADYNLGSPDKAGETLTISNIDTRFNKWTCEKTVTWQTNYPATTVIYYGADHRSMTEYATGAECTTFHAITVDVGPFRNDWAFKVESEPCEGPVVSVHQVDTRTRCSDTDPAGQSPND